MQNTTAPKYEYPQPDAREFWVPCCADDEAREDFYCPTLSVWQPKGRAPCRHYACGQHWRKKVSVPDNCEIVPGHEFQSGEMDYCDVYSSPIVWIPNPSGDHLMCDVYKDGTGSNYRVFIRRKPESAGIIATPHPSPAFWVVWRKNGPAPSKRHPAEADARKEAQRLADQSSERFYVLKACASFQRGPVEAKELQ